MITHTIAGIGSRSTAELNTELARINASTAPASKLFGDAYANHRYATKALQDEIDARAQHQPEPAAKAAPKPTSSTPAAKENVMSPELRAEWEEAKQMNAERRAREAAPGTLLAQVSGTVPYTRPSHVRILD